MANKKNRNRSGDPRVRASYGIPETPTQPPITGPTSADQWVSKTAGDDEDVRLPSGNVARVRRVGPEAFLTQGIMPDSVSPIVEKAIRSKKGLRPQEQAEMVKDPKQLGALMEMLDRTLCYAVLQPEVVMPPACTVCGELDSSQVEVHHDQSLSDFHRFVPGERQPGKLYADRVDLEDKMFVLNFVVGGTRDLERFRGELGAGVERVPAV